MTLPSGTNAPLRRVCLWTFVSALVSFHAAQAAPIKTDRTELLDGTILDGQVSAIDADFNVRIEGQSDPVSLAAVRRVQRPTRSARPPADDVCRVLLTDGGKMFASGINYRDDRVQGSWQFGKIDLPIKIVHAVRLQATLPEQRFLAALKRQNRDKDTLFVTIDDKLQEIEGYLETLTHESMTFEWQDAVRTVPRERVHGFVLALIEAAPATTGRCRTDMADGSSVLGRVLKLDDGQLTLGLAEDVTTRVPWQAVSRLTVYSPRLAFLSDMKPANVIQESIVTLDRPWQRDRSIEGRPLTLNERTFEKGLGVQSRSLLTFNADDKYDRLVATIGIDDETDGRGDCIFIVRGDGRELYRQRVQGGDPPRQLALDISDVRALTLLVEPGNGLDMADHADWCDARLIQSTR